MTDQKSVKTSKSKAEKKKFSPFEIFEELKNSNLDPSVFDKVDERDFAKAPNFLDWSIEPKFANTTVLPKQIEIGVKLCQDWCPRCSNPGYINTLFDQTIGNIKDNIQFLVHGVCPKCRSNRIELANEFDIEIKNELVGAMGQRCVPKDTLVYTGRGIIPIEQVKVGDLLSHGVVSEIFDSGTQDMLEIKTEHDWALRGAKNSHIVATKVGDEIVYKPIKELVVGDVLLLNSCGFWPETRYKLPRFGMAGFPSEVTNELARLTGYLVSDCASLCAEVTYDIRRCNLSVFAQLHLTENAELICKWLDFIGLDVATRRNKIPQYIMQSPKEVQAEFLAGLFGEANSVYKDTNGAISLRCISASELLIKQARIILLSFGIAARYAQLPSGYHMITTSDPSFVSVFASLVNLAENDKDRLIKSVVPEVPNTQSDITSQGLIPAPITSIVEASAVPMMDVSIPGSNVYTGDGFLHHNSGKTKLVGLLASYITHRFLKVPNPLRYFGQPTGELLLGTFSALTLEQASQTLWESYKGFISGSPWFSQYHSFLRSEEKRLGVELLHDLKNSILYTHKQMLWHCTGSQDRKMRGKTRIFAAIDELGWFIMDDSKPDLQNMNADAVYTALSNSLATMRMKYRILLTRGEYDAPPILMANVSSPSSAKDKIMRLLKDANKNTKILAVQLPSWLCNPDYTYETLRAEFNHVEESIFMRDFGVEPPLAQSPFMSDEMMLTRIAKGPVTTDYDTVEILDDVNKFKSARLRMHNANRGTPRMVTFDLGTTKNGLAACIFNLTGGKPTLEFVLAITPNPAAKIRINIADVYDNFTEPLVKSLNVKYVFFDRWQSLDQIERLRALGVTAEVYSLSYKDMDSVRGYINSEAVTIPKLHKPIQEIISDYVSDSPQWQSNPVGALCIQLLTVRDNGHRMMKPLQGDDDIFRAFCLGVVKLFDPSIKLTMQGTVAAQMASARAVGTVKPRSAKMGGLSGGKVTVDGIGAAFSRQRNR